MWKFFHKLASPPHFYSLAAKMIPWFYAAGVVAVIYGTVAGLFYAPIDEEMNDGFRIIYVHVPAAYISMSAYMVMAIGAGIGLIWRMKLAHAVAAGAAPLGAWFTFLALAHWLDLGAPDVGNLVGMGRSKTDIRTADAVSLFRLHSFTRGNRRYRKSRQSQCGVGDW